VLDAADARLRAVLRDPQLAPGSDPIDHYGFSRDFDDLGRERGESSYIAVVHADGNHMGRRFAARVDATYLDNRAWITAVRDFAEQVQQASEQALFSTTRALMAALKRTHLRRFAEQLPLDTQQRPILPFRPLVFGGDDVTFVCDGRLGLALATTYADAFEAATADRALGRCTVGVGVAIVKAHYPFARAYALSAALCRSAKEAFPAEDGTAYSAIDWHIALSGIPVAISGDDDARLALRSLHQHYYTVDQLGPLTMRPLLLGDEATNWRTWAAFTALIHDFTVSEQWRERRNKVLGLREALRSGPEAVRRFRVAYSLDRLDLPEIKNAPGDYQAEGWTSALPERRCAYFDALEAIDLYLPLDVPTTGAV
jgi:hypothetical protein